MLKILEEKRLYPRIKVNLRVSLLSGAGADSVDLSEGGLSFHCAKAILSPDLCLEMGFPGSEFKLRTDARLAWRRDLESGSFSCGAEFRGLSETQKQELRKELIRIGFGPLLGEIDKAQVKEDISRFFLKDTLDYINKILRFVSTVSREDAMLAQEDKELERMNNEILLKGYCLEELIDNKAMLSKIKEIFRSLVGFWVYKGNILKRAFEMRRGYPGDYAVTEAIYNNQPLSGGVGYYFDKYFLGSPYGVAVRYRKDRLREIIQSNIRQSYPGLTRICSVASGSCREIRELPMDIFEGRKVVFTCLDWDEEALGFSRQAVNNFPANVRFDFIKADIAGMVKSNNPRYSFEKQDVIYSAGLIDYLPDNMLKAFVYFFYSFLGKNGKLILTHKNKDKNFSPLAPVWFCDWKFVPRDRQEAAAIFYSCGIKDFSLSAESDEFNDIFYFTIIKRS